MATAPVDDDFDMPDFTDEMMAEFHAPVPEVVAPLMVLIAKDLHMGAAVVRHVNNPKTEPFDLIGLAIGLMYLGAIWLFVKAWTWVLFS